MTQPVRGGKNVLQEFLTVFERVAEWRLRVLWSERLIGEHSVGCPQG
jgi:hypothetical protein